MELVFQVMLQIKHTSLYVSVTDNVKKVVPENSDEKVHDDIWNLESHIDEKIK